MTTKSPLGTAIWEADRHLDTLEAALQDWQAAPAANLAVLETDREKLRILDQLLFRFTKLQGSAVRTAGGYRGVQAGTMIKALPG